MTHKYRCVCYQLKTALKPFTTFGLKCTDQWHSRIHILTGPRHTVLPVSRSELSGLLLLKLVVVIAKYIKTCEDAHDGYLSSTSPQPISIRKVCITLCHDKFSSIQAEIYPTPLWIKLLFVGPCFIRMMSHEPRHLSNHRRLVVCSTACPENSKSLQYWWGESTGDRYILVIKGQ